jgi:pimeloyl-ACP methyl ester carboxylesterase
MPMVGVNGIELYCREAGSGEPLVLIHGTGFNADVWDKVFDLLAHDYRTIAYDRRGYQRSKGKPAPAATYGADQGDDMVALIRALDAGPATILGWSSGAIYALHATLKHPDCVKRLILFEPPLYAIRYMDMPTAVAFVKLFLQKALGKRQAAAATFTRSVLGYRDGRNSYDSLSPEFRAKMAADADTLLAEINGGTGTELKPDVLASEIRVPVWLLIGEQTGVVFQRTVANLSRILQGAPIVQVPNGNHLAMIDQPDEFVKTVKKIMTSTILRQEIAPM